jgi:Carboxypeptidase regulatory-like domain
MKSASILSNARLFADLLVVICSTKTGVRQEAKSLSGVVRDSNGTVVADVAVSVSNVNTGKVINIRANRCGHYQVPSLRKGVYNVEASAPGFSPAKARNLVFSVAGRRRIDLSLKVGKANVTTIDVGDAEAGNRRQRIG